MEKKLKIHPSLERFNYAASCSQVHKQWDSAIEKDSKWIIRAECVCLALLACSLIYGVASFIYSGYSSFSFTLFRLVLPILTFLFWACVSDAPMFYAVTPKEKQILELQEKKKKQEQRIAQLHLINEFEKLKNQNLT